MDNESKDPTSHFSENDDSWNQSLFERTNLPLNTYKSRRNQNLQRNSNKSKDINTPKKMNDNNNKNEEKETQEQIVTKPKIAGVGLNESKENGHEKKDEESEYSDMNNNHNSFITKQETPIINDNDFNVQSEENVSEEVENKEDKLHNNIKNTFVNEKEPVDPKNKEEIEPKKQLRKSARLMKKKRKPKTQKQENERYDSEGNEIFYPEKIVRDRIYKGRKFPKKSENGEPCREYFIKWCDWPTKDNTWEHEQNLIPGALEMLEEYWSTKKKKQEAKNEPRKPNAGNMRKKRKLTEENMNSSNKNDNREEPPIKKTKIMSKEEIEKEWGNRDGEDYKKYCLKIKKMNPQKFFEFFGFSENI